jgi:hypothetical protein
MLRVPPSDDKWYSVILVWPEGASRDIRAFVVDEEPWGDKCTRESCRSFHGGTSPVLYMVVGGICPDEANGKSIGFLDQYCFSYVPSSS